VFALSTLNLRQISACCFHIIVEFLTMLLGLQNMSLLCLKVRYSDHLPMVLHGVTCTFWGGKKIGVVGRTGSGKSTLIQALFRMVDPVGGRIVIDGLDISTIGLHDLRSRLSIIPQDPTLFEGTVRGNLDPLGEHSDTEVWEVLSFK
jgi:ABC-type multidrug transport system fused ATPase/permease subunit